MNPAHRELHNEKVRVKYNQKIHTDPTFYKAEKVRVAKYQKQRYNTDKVYKKKIQVYNKMKMREYALIDKINNMRI